jgi:DNA-binding transcriptional LysR family regulator
MLQPNDFRDLLAISRARSLNGAARALGVNASTMSRRLASIEERLGRALFLRANGFAPTPEGERAIAVAERMEAEALGFERELIGDDEATRWELRITAAEWGIPLLSGAVTAMARDLPSLEISLLIDNRLLDLSRREADLALRVGRPRGDALVARRLGTFRYGLFASAGYLAAAGVPRTRARLAHHTFATLTGPEQLPHVQWQRSLAGGARVRIRSNSTLALVQAARAGAGLAVLPDVLARSYPELRPVLPRERLSADLWLAYHRDLRRSRGVRKAIDGLVAHLDRLLRGTGTRSELG